MKVLGVMLLLLSTYGVATAAIPVTPEIDAQSGVSALMLVSGAILVIRGRR
jgi:hypothetical protein